MSTPDIRIKRIYDEPDDDDGYRVLVDRLWPRGVTKEAACLDAWLKEIAPSVDLRTWFDHDPAKFDGFAARYRAELSAQAEVVEDLRSRARSGAVTLLYAARSETHNHARVLQDHLCNANR